MRVVHFGPEAAAPITLFNSANTYAAHLGSGEGEAHVYAIHMNRDAMIGPHPAGFDQLFLVAHGEGWASGEDGTRVPLTAGQGAYIAKGEVHSKGSESGMMAIMVQVTSIPQ